VKFTDEGEVTVTLDRRLPGRFRIEVSDTGVSVAEARLPFIFDSYAQAERSTAGKYGGSGLGLAIVRRLVDSMEGEITVASRPGEGATFRVAIATPETTMSPPAAPSHEMLIRAAAGRRVLAVDDVPTNRLVIERLLARLGAHATVVDNAEAALTLVGVASFDVVLMDISMPGMSGVDALRAIRDKEMALGLDPTPLIATTANALRHQVEEYLALGFAGHLAKPIDLHRLAAALARARGRSTRTGILDESPASAKTSG
jgi:CheY-like chemotaxis protein